jgi:hypothetical protein
MRRALIGWLLCAPALAWAADSPDGRWEGSIRIPGRDLPLIVDLAPAAAGGWTGSLIIPGLGLKGAPLSNIVVGGADVAFDLGAALRDRTYGPAKFNARMTGAGSMTGELQQAGNVAPFSLAKVGRAQVEAAPASTAVRRDLEAAWSGQAMLGDYPRTVTITVANHAGGAATATFKVVGKQVTVLPVDFVAEEGEFLRVESQANRVAFEGRFAKDRDEIAGSLALGSFELPLVLRRAKGDAS